MNSFGDQDFPDDLLKDRPLKTDKIAFGRSWYYPTTRSHSAIERWLASNVGRSWSKVLPEFIKFLGKNATKHFANSFVADEVVPGFISRNGFVVELKVLSRPETYVSRGILKRFVPRPKKIVLFQRPDRIVIDPRRQLHKKDGIWYELVLAPIPDDLHYHDCFLRGRYSCTLPVTTYGSRVYAVSKKALSKKQLAKHGIKND